MSMRSTVQLKSGYALPYDKDVGAVIVGFDRFINYYKIQYAQVPCSTAAYPSLFRRVFSLSEARADSLRECVPLSL